MRWRPGFVAACGLLVSMVACSYYTTSSDDADAGAGDVSTGSSASSSGSQSASSSGAPVGSSNGSSGTPTGSSGTSGTSSTSSTSSSSSTGGPALNDFEQGLLDGFNAARASASPAPDPSVPVLYWDYEAAGACASYSATCGAAVAPDGMVYGRGTTPVAASAIVNFLVAKGDTYTYATNHCGDGDKCNFYKMVVKRSVVKVGCAITTCSEGDTWACVFTPVGDLQEQPY